jgi:hypothetical protein
LEVDNLKDKEVKVFALTSFVFLLSLREPTSLYPFALLEELAYAPER